MSGFIDVQNGVRAEVDRIGTRGPTAVVLVWIEHLHGHRFPAAGGTAVEKTRPAFADAAETFFDLRDQFISDRVTVWTKVGRIDGVGVVVIRVRVLDLDNDKAREVWPGPILVKLIRLLLNDAVVAVEFEACAVLGLQVRIGRLFAKVAEVRREMSVIDNKRVARFGMRVETFRQQDVRAEMHRASPELRQTFTLNLDVLDVLRVFGRFDRRDYFIERDRDWRVAADPHTLRGAIEISRRAVPLLSFATVHREFDCVTICAFESFVTMEQRLHCVLAGRHVGETAPWITKRALVQRFRLARFPGVDVNAEVLLSVEIFVDLKTRLAFGTGRDQQ